MFKLFSFPFRNILMAWAHGFRPGTVIKAHLCWWQYTKELFMRLWKWHHPDKILKELSSIGLQSGDFSSPLTLIGPPVSLLSLLLSRTEMILFKKLISIGIYQTWKKQNTKVYMREQHRQVYMLEHEQERFSEEQEGVWNGPPIFKPVVKSVIFSHVFTFCYKNRTHPFSQIKASSGKSSVHC